MAEATDEARARQNGGNIPLGIPGRLLRRAIPHIGITAVLN